MPWRRIFADAPIQQLRVLGLAITESRDGITIASATEPDRPLVYVNPAFERMTGYSFEEAVGRNCRYLQAGDRDQPALAELRNAIELGEPCTIVLRNYRKDGTRFYNDLSVSPIHDEHGTLTHHLGIQKDVTARFELEEALRNRTRELEAANLQLRALSQRDPLTGLYNRRYFDEQLALQWQIARRAGSSLSLFMIDVDLFKFYNDRYGHPAGDACLRRIALALGSAFMRASDFVVRYGGEEFAVLAASMTVDQAARFAETLCQRITELRIEHAASPLGICSVSVGHSTVRVDGSSPPAELLAQADDALYKAKRQGRNRAVAAPELHAGSAGQSG